MDHAAGDTGTLLGWSLDIAPAISNCSPVKSTVTTVTNLPASYSTAVQPLTLNAAWPPSPPGVTVNEGTVTFTVMQGATQIGVPVTSGPVANGAARASYTLPGSTPVGVNTLTATYNPIATNPNFGASASAAGTLTVTPDATTTGVTNANAPFATTGQAVALHATVTFFTARRSRQRGHGHVHGHTGCNDHWCPSHLGDGGRRGGCSEL